MHSLTDTPKHWPEGHDLVRVGQVAPRVLHLSRVWVTDLVIGAAVVGAFNHDDIRAGAAQFDGVGLTGQLPAHHCHGDGSTAMHWTHTDTHTHCYLVLWQLFILSYKPMKKQDILVKSFLIYVQ